MFVPLNLNQNKFLQKYILFSMYKNFIFGYNNKFLDKRYLLLRDKSLI